LAPPPGREGGRATDKDDTGSERVALSYSAAGGTGFPYEPISESSRLRTARTQFFQKPARRPEHQKRIFQRDLKPSNILMAPTTGAPAPKVIDFGLAKPVREPLTGQTLHTSYANAHGHSAVHVSGTRTAQ
jgi:hypothetical protein